MAKSNRQGVPEEGAGGGGRGGGGRAGGRARAGARRTSRRRRSTTPNGKPPEKPPLFNGVVSYGNLVFISGIGAHFEGDIKAHTKHVLDEMKKSLERAGSSMEKVLKVNVYLNDLKDYAGMNEVFLGSFGRSRASARRSRRPAAFPATRWSRSTASPTSDARRF